MASLVVTHLITSLPKGDNHYMKSKVSRYGNKLLGKHDVTTTKIKLRFWQVEMQALQVVCSEYGIYVALPPENAFEATMLLGSDYYGGVSMHGNIKY